MSSNQALMEIGADDFARRFSLRASNLMWLLGAGASASAGIPTAGQMIWEFKQQLFISQRRVSPHSVSDLGSSAIRAQLQAHIDSLKRLPTLNALDEYAALFEAVYPAEADRRAFLDAKMAGAQPSFGHLALASLMHGKRARIVWTTNFDPLLANACALVYGSTGPLTTVSLDAPDLAKQSISNERWPIEVKLHGDFRSRRLKNTSDELRHQDVQLRQILVESCCRFGLVISGYSGRDESIMNTLEEALKGDQAFPSGLFWLQRSGDPLFPRVKQFMERAASLNVEASVVRVANFDEALRDLVRLMEDIDTTELDSFALERRRWSGAPRPTGSRGWPVVRLNALPVVQSPSVCRRVVCQIGGYREVRDAVEQADVDLLVARTRAGVLAFGTDSDVRVAFKPYSISDFDLHTIEMKRLRFDSGERGLLRDALTRAIVQNRGLELTRRRSSDLLTPVDTTAPRWSPLRTLVGTLNGNVSSHPGLTWKEGVSIRLDWANDHLWLLIEPRIVFHGVTQSNKAAASDFARERNVKRYNRQLNDLISFWSSSLAGQGDDLRAFGIGDGVDATFRLSSKTGFSRRAGV